MWKIIAEIVKKNLMMHRFVVLKHSRLVGVADHFWSMVRLAIDYAKGAQTHDHLVDNETHLSTLACHGGDSNSRILSVTARSGISVLSHWFVFTCPHRDYLHLSNITWPTDTSFGSCLFIYLCIHLFFMSASVFICIARSNGHKWAHVYQIVWN